MNRSSLIVLKFGGSSLATSKNVLSIAQEIATLRQRGKSVLVVVSAMGETTDELVALAESISRTPDPRELDMLLSTGERVSMALLSMALKDLGVPSISFTGSQAGILTDSAHTSARIVDLRPQRVREALVSGKVVVLAGFQGMDPVTKEITTLGRGGSDLTAVAMAAHFGAEGCHIRKDVAGVYTADPRVIKESHLIPLINWSSLLEMTYWGSPILHFRSVELAYKLKVPLHVTLAHPPETSRAEIQNQLAHGTTVSDTNLKYTMSGKKVEYETGEVISVNSHSLVRRVQVTAKSLGSAVEQLRTLLHQVGLPWPQILDMEGVDSHWIFHITAPQEALKTLGEVLKKRSDASPSVSMSDSYFATVTTTCHGSVASDFITTFCEKLETHKVHPIKVLVTPLSLTAIVGQNECIAATQALHELVTPKEAHGS